MNGRHTIAIICPQHGYIRGSSCPHCAKKERGIAISIFKPMIYEDICETPLLIESKRQLRNECNKHGVIAARLL